MLTCYKVSLATHDLTLHTNFNGLICFREFRKEMDDLYSTGIVKIVLSKITITMMELMIKTMR